MRVGSHLVAQLERCGLSAQLAEQHQEVSDDASGSRATRIEIARAYHANDQAQLPEANAALQWLMGEGGKLLSVCEPLDLVDPETGEVLVSGKPGAVLMRDDGEAGEVLVIAWQVGEQHEPIEPDDDLGLVAMGLASTRGVMPFRVAHVVAKGNEAFCRRSEVFPVTGHAALLERIRKAVSRPRIACPGDWCGACRQAPYCEAWLARARVAMTVFGEETGVAKLVADGADAVEKIPQVDLTNENAGAFALRIKLVEKALKLAKDQRNAFVRRGGVVVVNGKQLHLGEVEGRETADVAALKANGLGKYIKVGKPFETSRWKNVESATKGKRR